MAGTVPPPDGGWSGLIYVIVAGITTGVVDVIRRHIQVKRDDEVIRRDALRKKLRAEHYDEESGDDRPWNDEDD